MIEHPVSGKQPSTAEQSFSCPHCGAYTSQTWGNCHGEVIGREDGATPLRVSRQKVEELEKSLSRIRDDDERGQTEKSVAWAKRVLLGRPFTERMPNKYVPYRVDNLFTSKCYVCSEMAIWVGDKIVYPPARSGVPPSQDLPPEIAVDFEEARSILDLSPRGAAALLRLCVQKLCLHLGEPGKNIDDDIASLVKKGLAPQIQQALDAVRVIGNEAVHPGAMDLKDDKETAGELFSILNFIADEMITKPKKLAALYAKLPVSKRNAIEQRNARAIGTPGA
ncbi:MAG TPA: DUF4145 domain-containing protein [Pseudorhodoferax sp.]|nr:DUF4145 domain-containing protein [Pseudorhodoferax sp.]